MSVPGMFDALPRPAVEVLEPEQNAGPRPIVPVPDDAPGVSAYRHPNFGKPDRLFAYQDAARRLLCYVGRWESETTGRKDKTLRPITFCELAGGRRAWRAHGVPAPRPLYGLHDVAARPDAPVLVVEGEGKRDAAARTLPDYAVVSPMHGAKSSHLADWRPVAGRRVVVWPDHDTPGTECARIVAAECRKAGAAAVGVVDVPPEFPEAWDLADELPEDWTVERLRELLDQAAAQASNGHIASAAEAKAERPQIEVRDELGAVVDEAEAALLANSESELYVRGGVLVRVLREAKRSKVLQRPDGGPMIGEATVPFLRERMDRAARWMTWKRKNLVPALPPTWAAETLIHRGSWSFPYLAGVVETPTLRPDGTVLEQPGYDVETGLLYEPTVDYPPVPLEPSREEASRAAAELLAPLCDFPFVSTVDEAVVLSAVLALLARPAIDGPCPMKAMRAPSPGTGKGLLADYVALVGTGRRAARMSSPRDDDESRKRILSIALDGARVVLLDNVEGALGSQSLAAALTATTWSDRLLGVNRTVTLPLLAVWLCTGNNTVFRGDLGRRVLPCDLDAKQEHPEDRAGFVHSDLLAYVRAERPRLVTAGLTILRAFCVAGRPTHGQPAKGSFESWDALVRASIVWATGVDPVATTERIRRDGDTELDSLRAALGAWEQHLGPTAVTAAAVVHKARSEPELGAALAGLADCEQEKLGTRKLGYALRRAKGRVVDGRSFERTGEDKSCGALWSVVRVRGDG